ncbi:MAG: N-acetyl-gamma-glutamyl-phosphate reductase [Endomicrobia bacterium]|nr:N-acetyl-gamma-glutamyl-phosphate reductase [Endomicrobiia bacterium]
MKKRVALAGTSGITAAELLKLLIKHNSVDIKYLLSSSFTPHTISEEIFEEVGDIKILTTFDSKTYRLISNENIDLIFLCLPHKVSMDFLKACIDVVGEKNLPRVIDLSADFRIKNVKLYEEFYGCQHQLPHLVDLFVYGLPECEPTRKEKIKRSNFVANPGCYPTTVILGLSPIVSQYEIDEIIIDAKSGYSGGGKKLVTEYESYGGNNTYPYNVYGKHRHIPEIKEQLAELAKKEINFLFTPYVIPQYQGMLTTIYVKFMDNSLNLVDIRKQYISFYKDCTFIRILDEGKLPETRNVIKTNYCDISFAKEEGSCWIKIFVAIDNLIKGAVGQAVQNMNLMFGLNETEGLL